MIDYVNYLGGEAMLRTQKTQVTPTFYLSLLEFLLSGKQHIVAIGNELGLTSIQTITLMLIDETRPRPMGSLGTLFHCDASNVTGIIDGLEQKGLVERASDPKDRRVKVVRLLPEGRTTRQLILARLSSDSDFPFDSLNSSERQQFIHIVTKLAASRRLN